MSRIQAAFERVEESGRRAFIPFLTAGDPTLAYTEKIVLELARIGADIVEIGIPYSDPLADGPTIQAAALRALSKSISIEDVFTSVRNIRSQSDVPIVMFTYVNPVIQYGIDRFFQTLSDIGADGVIIPDLPIEESDDALAAARRTGVDLIPLVAPTSEDRIQKICDQAMGFVYCVSSLGVTGVRSELPKGLEQFVEKVRASTQLPLGVGFGVGSAEMAREVGKVADGVIVGSAIVRQIEKIAMAVDAADENQEQAAYSDLIAFAQSIRDALDRGDSR